MLSTQILKKLHIFFYISKKLALIVNTHNLKDKCKLLRAPWNLFSQLV